MRQSQKDIKRQRIFEAARERFERDGFDATTIRAIANDAGVAAGTVLLYANSKQALLQEVWRAEMMAVVEEAVINTRGGSLNEALLSLFTPLLRAYSARPNLARVVVKELPWLDGPASESHREDLHRFLEVIALEIRSANQRGESTAEPTSTADLLFTVYYGACWKLLKPDAPLSLEATIEWLAAQIAIVLRGSQR